jgi:hypothetical protein
LTVSRLRVRHSLDRWKRNTFQPIEEMTMSRKEKFESFWKSARELFAGLVFTSVIVVVVGGTTAMLLEPSVLFA